MVKAVWKGKVLAESADTLFFDNNHYFPPESLNKEYFRPSETHSTCFWKGTASYHSIEVDGQSNIDAAWFYPNPSAEAAKIKNYVAFWMGVEIIKS